MRVVVGGDPSAGGYNSIDAFLHLLELMVQSGSP